MKQIIRQIDLWFDHKPSQAIHPFIAGYYHPEGGTFDYDEVVIAPNLVGNCQISVAGETIDNGISPEFNGGVIFLKNGQPKRLYLCHVNDRVTNSIGQKFSTKYIDDVLNSDADVDDSGKSLRQLLDDAGVKRRTDESIHSKYVSKQKYVDKTDPAFESADQLLILQDVTFLNSVEDWESISFYPDIESRLSIEGTDFDIEIKHKGLIAGVKKNQKYLPQQLQGRKAYAIALQTNDKQQYEAMIEYTKSFVSKVNAKEKIEPNGIVDLKDGVLEQ